jgi:hypothetical protein
VARNLTSRPLLPSEAPVSPTGRPRRSDYKGERRCVTVRLPSAAWLQLVLAANQRDMSPSALALEVLTEFIDAWAARPASKPDPEGVK